MSPRATFARHAVVNLTLTLLALVACALAAAPALADPPARVTIVAVFDPITIGENDYVNGQLLGADNKTGQPGQPVQLEQSPPPFTDWLPVAQVTSDAEGYYSFALQPTQTLRYRTSSQGVASERSVQISVAPRLTFKARTAGGKSVRFSGTITPALAGQAVAIQRRARSGSWKTVAKARLRQGQTFAGLLHTKKPVVLRAFYSSDGAHRDAFSRSVRVRF